MTEPTRLLLDTNAPEEAAALLRSLCSPVQPSAAKQAQLAHQLAALASTTAVATIGIALWLKAAAVVLALGVVSAWVGVKLNSPQSAHAVVPAASPVATSSMAAVVPNALAVQERMAVAPTQADTERDSPSAGSRTKVAARDTLADEEALLEQARRLAAGSPSKALALLQQYQRRFPMGKLAAERMLLSVDVLTRLGNTAGARKQADALIRAFPNSVYTAQVRMLSPQAE